MKTIRPKYKIITKKKVSKQHRGNISNLVLLEKIIFKLNYENIEESVHSIFELFGTKNKYTIFNVVCQLVYSSFVSQMKDFDMYLMFLKSLEEKYRKKNIINVLVRFLLFLETHEAIYLLEQLYEKGLIGINILLKKKTLYFINYASDKNYFKNKPIYFYRKFDENCFVYYEKNSWNLIYKKIKDNFDNHLEELSRNDWELHKQLIKEGHNPNEIAKIIRNDDIEKLQEMSSQNDFDFNQKIEPSLYERCSFINQENVSLIDYAAFFSAIKCFKYLLMNNAKVNNAGKYAVAGGNEEIIYLCEQNHSVFEDAYEAAIEFHRNDIFKYLYENELDEIDRTFNFYYGFYERKNIQFKKSYILGVKCVLSSSYELLSF